LLTISAKAREGTAFARLLVVIRLGGKRTITKMNVFDFVFTVARIEDAIAVVLETDGEFSVREGNCRELREHSPRCRVR
jgi:hypothetical protein